MTGTAMVSAGELRRIYKVHVVEIPTNQPCIRQRLTDRVFGNAEEKWSAVVDEVCQLHTEGRPVLIGTRSIDKSELLSKLLDMRGVKHEVLNANHVAEEAEIVAHAGEPGQVIVSTNMAGRGTDIKLPPGMAELGGLHVICTEMHDSARIDRQLMGRSARQGDPGSCRQYLALDDDLVGTGFGPDKAKKYRGIGENLKGELTRYRRLFRKAQRKVERKHFRDRRSLMYYEKERKKTHRQMGQDPYLDMPG
jgi:preprotein translocase subunit SecA